MSDTLPAAATGLPEASTFDRRSFIATLAAAGVMGAGAVFPADAAEHPDQAMMDLEALYIASRARLEEFDRQVDEAFDDRYEDPEIPEALFLRAVEPVNVFPPRDRLPTFEIDGVPRPFCENGIEDLIYGAQSYITGRPFPKLAIRESSQARIHEIKDAHDAWRAAVRAAEDAAGITGPRNAGSAEVATMDEIVRAAMSTRVATLEGIGAKARIALMSNFLCPDFAEKELLPQLLTRTGNVDTTIMRIAFALSVLVDAAKFGAHAVAAQEGRVAA